MTTQQVDVSKIYGGAFVAMGLQAPEGNEGVLRVGRRRSVWAMRGMTLAESRIYRFFGTILSVRTAQERKHVDMSAGKFGKF